MKTPIPISPLDMRQLISVLIAVEEASEKLAGDQTRTAEHHRLDEAGRILRSIVTFYAHENEHDTSRL